MKLARLVVLCALAMFSQIGAVSASTANMQATESQFLSGLTAVSSGDYKGAIAIFQSILASDPSLMRVRLELARAYFLDEQWNRSRSEFFKVLSGDIPEPVRQKVLGFIRAIDARRGFEWDFEIGVKRLGSTRNYDTDEIDLDFSGITLPATLDRSDESPYGIGYSGSALWRTSLDSISSKERLVVAFGEVFSFGDLSEEKTYRDVTIGVRGGARFVFPESTAVISPVLTTRYLADESFENRLGMEVAFERRNLNAYSIFGSISGYRVDNKLDETFSGNSAIARLGMRRSFGGKSTIGVALYGETKSTERDIDTYTIAGLEAFGSFDVGRGYVVEPRVYLAKKAFQDINPLFVGNPDEDQYGAMLRVEKRNYIVGNGFVPFAELEYNRVNSGINAFSYNETLFNVGFTNAF